MPTMWSDALLRPDACHESLRGFPIVVRLPIHWGEQDDFGHVNNINYLRWCETARVYYLDRIGLWHTRDSTGVGPILASIRCDFRRPVTFPDTVQVGARVTGIGNSSFRMEHWVFSEEMGVVAAEGDSTLVVLDYNSGKTVPLPGVVRQAIAALEGREIR